ncbi:MAG: hypothetical protein QM765_14115 [Myxococcales bacterium]
MRIRNLLGAALALALVPGAAFAADESKAKTCEADCNSAATQSGSVQQGQATGVLDENGNCICTPSAKGSVGGSGTGIGAESGSSAQGGSTSGSVGGTGTMGGTSAQGSEEQGATNALPPGTNTNNQNVTVIPSEQASAKKNEDKGQMGLMLTADGGVEGYTSSLAPKISPGPAWGVTLTAMPTKIVGVELQLRRRQQRREGPGGGRREHADHPHRRHRRPPRQHPAHSGGALRLRWHRHQPRRGGQRGGRLQGRHLRQCPARCGA